MITNLWRRFCRFIVWSADECHLSHGERIKLSAERVQHMKDLHQKVRSNVESNRLAMVVGDHQ